MIHCRLQFLLLSGSAATSICIFIIIGVLSALASTLTTFGQRKEITFAFSTCVGVAALQTILQLRRLTLLTVPGAITFGLKIERGSAC